MMNNIGFNYGFIALWGLHVLSVIVFFTGVLFLIVLAIKTFDAAQLRSWALWLLVIGTVVCLFTIAMIGRPWLGLIGYWNAGMKGMQMQRLNQMMERMMGEMEEHDAGRNEPAHMQMEEMLRELHQDGRQGDLLTQ